MITQVDRTDKFEVQKITKTDGGLLRYQVVELPAGDSAKVRQFATLEAARLVIGKTNGGKTLN